jgi:hypothetical protein
MSEVTAGYWELRLDNGSSNWISGVLVWGEEVEYWRWELNVESGAGY